MAELCTYYSICLFCESDTPPKKVLLGIRPRGTKVCRGFKPRGLTFKYKYFREFETEFKNILGCEFGAIWGQFVEKTRSRKSHATVPLTWNKETIGSCLLSARV
jgi:hypothetical protein